VTIGKIADQEKEDLPAIHQRLNQGVNPNNPTEFTSHTPLSLAAKWGHVQTARALLDAGADPNLKDHYGVGQLTPLHVAAGQGHVDVMRLLLDRGGEVNARDLGDCTPLHHAAQYNPNSSPAKMLLEAGADASLTNEEGKTALDIASRGKGKHRVDIVDLLKKA